MTRIAAAEAADGGPITLINMFTVAPGEAERFLRHWRDSARIMAAQPGFIRARMYRAVESETETCLVNVADWASRTAFDEATANPRWRATIQRAVDDPALHLTARPAIFGLAFEVRPGDAP